MCSFTSEVEVEASIASAYMLYTACVHAHQPPHQTNGLSSQPNFIKQHLPTTVTPKIQTPSTPTKVLS